MRASKTSYSPICHEYSAILTALSAGPLGRSEIIDAVIGDTVGGLVLGKSSFYRYIKELELTDFIEGQARYNLTEKGWRTLHRELNRIEQHRLILKKRLHI